MSSLFKDVYNPAFYAQFSEILAQTLPTFDKIKFTQLIFDDKFDGYELKQRMTHTAKVLSVFLDNDLVQAKSAIKAIIEALNQAGMTEQSIEFMFFPEYIEMHGLEDYETSVDAFEFITQFTSCEFAVRPYIEKYSDKMLDQMLLWSKHSDNRVRRLASEGSRPRLPWAMALAKLKKDPLPLLPILNNLKQDTCEGVRRSVANNLNDIAKDNPDFVINVAKQWQGISEQTDALIKHGCRTLLKQGNVEVLKLFGFDSAGLELTQFAITTAQVTIGDKLTFSFAVSNVLDSKKLVRLEYGLYYMKNNGELSRKVFKISEREIAANKTYQIERSQSFKLITTRKFYPGKHQVTMIINGQESQPQDFELLDA